MRAFSSLAEAATSNLSSTFSFSSYCILFLLYLNSGCGEFVWHRSVDGRDFNSFSRNCSRSSLLSCASRSFFAHDGVLSGEFERPEDFDFERLDDFDLERGSFLGGELWREPLDDSQRASASWRSLRERFRDSLAGLTLWAKRR